MQSQCHCIPTGTRKSSISHVAGQKVVKSLNIDREDQVSHWITDLVINDRLSNSSFSLHEESVSQHVWSFCATAANLTFHVPSQQLFGLKLYFSGERVLWISCQGQSKDLPLYAFKRTNFPSDCSGDPEGHALEVGLTWPRIEATPHIAWNGFNRSRERIKPIWSSSNFTAFWNKANHLLSLNQASKVQILNNLTTQCSASNQKLLEMPRISRM